MTNISLFDSIISVQGKVFCNDGRRRIDLKKPVRDIFEPTDEPINYVMEICLSKNKLVNRTQELLSEEIIPVLLYFKVKR